MLKYYYKFWVDTVLFIRKKQKNEDNLNPLFMMAVPLTLNIFFLNLLLDFLGKKINILGIPHQFLSFLGIQNRFLGIIIGLFLILLPHYLLIFKGGKIENLIQKYPHYNGNFFISYFLITTIIPFIAFVAWFVYAKYLQ